MEAGEIVACTKSGRGYVYTLRHADGRSEDRAASSMGKARLRDRVEFHRRFPGMPLPRDVGRLIRVQEVDGGARRVDIVIGDDDEGAEGETEEDEGQGGDSVASGENEHEDSVEDPRREPLRGHAAGIDVPIMLTPAQRPPSLSTTPLRPSPVNIASAQARMLSVPRPSRLSSPYSLEERLAQFGITTSSQSAIPSLAISPPPLGSSLAATPAASPSLSNPRSTTTASTPFANASPSLGQSPVPHRTLRGHTGLDDDTFGHLSAHTPADQPGDTLSALEDHFSRLNVANGSPGASAEPHTPDTSDEVAAFYRDLSHDGTGNWPTPTPPRMSSASPAAAPFLYPPSSFPTAADYYLGAAVEDHTNEEIPATDMSGSAPRKAAYSQSHDSQQPPRAAGLVHRAGQGSRSEGERVATVIEPGAVSPPWQLFDRVCDALPEEAVAMLRGDGMADVLAMAREEREQAGLSRE